jgi:hypothetical protein
VTRGRLAPRLLARLTFITVAAVTSLSAFGLLGPTAGAAKSELPPPDVKALTALFSDKLQPYGLRITRGLLQNPSNYKPDPEGTHLALYVEPKSAQYSTADYVNNFSKLTHEFVPLVFNRWPGLESFDICQEPLNDTREAPPPVTQIYLTRDALDRVSNWKKASLTELLAAAPVDRRRNSGYYVYFNSDTRADPGFVRAADAADYAIPGQFGY